MSTWLCAYMAIWAYMEQHATNGQQFDVGTSSTRASGCVRGGAPCTSSSLSGDSYIEAWFFLGKNFLSSPLARLSPIARTLRDRGNPPPSPEEEKIEYDTYGWFNFDSDAEGVRRLDRQWVSAHALALVDAAGWKAAVDVWHKKVTPTSTNSREGPVGAAQHSPEQA